MTLLLLLTGIALALPVVINAVVYLDRRRVLRGTCEGNDPLPAPVAIRAFLFECGAILWSFGARVLLRGPATAGKAGHLVILVASYGLHPKSFWLLERRLRLLGFDTIRISPGCWTTPPDRAAAELGGRLVRIREASHHPVSSILVFGCAGLLVRRWLCDQPTAAFQQLITLGTPHQGTLGLVSRFERFRFAHPSSSFLRELVARDTVPRRFEAIALSSELDAWVVPNDAAYYPGAFNIVVRDVGHFSLVLSKRIVELLVENLKTAIPAQRN